MSELRLVDRSRTTCDWQCGRKRYLQYEWGGRGIVSGKTHLELFLGSCLHDALAAIAMQHKAGAVDIDAIATTAQKHMMESLLVDTNGEVGEIDYASEQACLVEGLIRGFYRHSWNSLITQYPNIIAIEEEVQYKIDDSILFMAKPDLVLADNEGNWHYCEYKSTSSKSENWVNSWATAVQLQSTVKAIEQTLGTMPTSVLVVGLYQGVVSYH